MFNNKHHEINRLKYKVYDLSNQLTAKTKREENTAKLLQTEKTARNSAVAHVRSLEVLGFTADILNSEGDVVATVKHQDIDALEFKVNQIKANRTTVVTVNYYTLYSQEAGGDVNTIKYPQGFRYSAGHQTGKLQQQVLSAYQRDAYDSLFKPTMLHHLV